MAGKICVERRFYDGGLTININDGRNSSIFCTRLANFREVKQMSTSVAIITARGGSKRIPRKNIKYFLGKPIISYSINAAIKSNCFDEIMVSTDDSEIAEVALKYGAKVPFLRSLETSDDFSGTSDVLYEVLREYEKRNILFDYACCLYPAAPFITEKLLNDGFEKLIKNNASTLFPVAEYHSPIWRALDIKDDKLSRIWPENEIMRSQDLQKTYFDVGQFYWLKVEDFLKTKKLLTINSIPIILPWSQIQDIDTPDDWIEAELKYRLLNKELLLNQINNAD